MMKFSVIMPSRLTDYPSSAKNKDQKLLRAINSVKRQTFDDWELHVIADGCARTAELVEEDERIHLWQIEHTKLWSGRPRNKGIEESKGEWIVYLDIDDVYGENHLKIISDNLALFDWVWYNDIRYNTILKQWFVRECDIHTLGRHGTSNVAHKRSLGLFWDEEGKYAHDYHFARKLLTIKNGGRIPTAEYYVCHIPGTPNTGGYDL